MMEKARHHVNYRNIEERLYITGYLTLLTPTHFGAVAGRGDALVDMSLLLDEEERLPLIPGTTIAGALRSYLRTRLHGYKEAEPKETNEKNSAIARLFGPTRESDEQHSRFQSLLIVDDALGDRTDSILRDGVRIDPKTRTADEGKEDEGGAKFDVELLQPGVRFQLNFEVLLTKEMPAAQVLPALVAALEGFEKGAIRLGLRKRRGYGQCRVDGWHVRRYKLTDPAQLCAWLDSTTVANLEEQERTPICSLLSTFKLDEAEKLPDQRSYFDICATFGLSGSSLLIRSGFGEADTGPDMVHLHSVDVDGARIPVIPGTSWAGVLRHRALRIVNTILGQAAESQEVVDQIFGYMPKQGQKVGTASRLVVDETPVRNGQILYQTRVRIDRFTGGALETALFEQAPIYGKEETEVDFHVCLLDPKPHEKGLLMLLLKDLWTQDLPVGGEASVGRGRLTGLRATITERDGTDEETAISLVQNGNGLGLTSDQQQTLQGYVDALWQKLKPGEEQSREQG